MRHAALALALAMLVPAVLAPGSALAASCRDRVAIECPRISVPLDRSGAVPGTISLYAERLGSERRSARALLFLAGGPGQAATPLIAGFAPALSAVLSDRDVLTFDQRGTGRSGRLRCGEERSRTIRGAISNCALLLGPQRDSYATSDSVADIEDLRAALGVERLVLYGTSYGTKVALEYAAAHPEHVESLVLDSVVLPGPRSALPASTLAALPRVLRDLCGGGRCSGITEDPYADLVALEQRLEGAPLRVRRITSHGRVLWRSVNLGTALGLLLTGDFDPALRAEMPGVLAAARAGDLAPLTRLAGDGGELSHAQATSDPLYLATTCSDTALPWVPGASWSARERGLRRSLMGLGRAVLGGLPARSALSLSPVSACAAWPSPVRVPAPVRVPDVPTLILSGLADLRTPTSDARTLARALPHATLLALSGRGHSVIGGTLKDCAGRALLAFLRGRPIVPCAARAVPPPVRPAPRTLGDADPLGARGVPGRLARAALATVADVIANGFIGSNGGLRGGWFHVTEDGELTLHRVRVVTGVRVSGTISGDRARLRVQGAGRRGTLELRGRRLRGSIGRARVRSRLAAPLLGAGSYSASASGASRIARMRARNSAASAP